MLYMKNFVKMTKLSGIKGRSEYISDPKRQENLIYASKEVDWTPYVKHEKNKSNHGQKNNEGRELIIALPNSWDYLSMDKLKEKTKDLVELSIQKNTDYHYAVHYNKSKTNLHLHIVFSERTMTDNIQYYKRNVYLRPDGKVARNKSERAKDDHDNDLPAIYKKGDIKSSGLTKKDTRYKQKSWLNDTKERIKDHYISQNIDMENPKVFELHEYHEGRGTHAEDIKILNKAIRSKNQELNILADHGTSTDQLISEKKSFLKKIKGNTINSIKEFLNQVISTFNEKSDLTDSVLTKDKSPDDTFVPFSDDEIKLYKLYENKKMLLERDEKITEKLNDHINAKDRIKYNLEHSYAKEYYAKYQKLRSSIFKGRSKKYYKEHKDDIGLYAEIVENYSSEDINELKKTIENLTNEKEQIKNNVISIDEMANEITLKSPNFIRIEEKDVLSGESLSEIKKSLKSKSMLLEFEYSPERCPRRSLKDEIEDAKRSADAYNRDRSIRNRNNDYEL